MTRGTIALTVVALAGACTRGLERQSVDGIRVAETDEAARLEGVGVTREQIRRSAVEALRAAPVFGPPAPEGGKARRWRALVVVQRVSTAAHSGPPVAQVFLTLELSPLGSGSTLRESTRAFEPVGPGAGAHREALARATAAALSRAVDGLALLIAAEGKKEKALITDLGSADARVRDAAVRALADRRSQAAVPALVERLADPDPEVVERAVGALGQIGDPRAVPALVRLAQKRTGPSVGAIARIIGDLGGPDARAYLLTLASGHPDPAVRDAAQQALDEMAARAAGPAEAVQRR